MAPRKRKAPAGPSLPARVTRSAAKLAAAAAAGSAEPSSSVAVEKKSKKGKQKKEVEEKEKGSTEDSVSQTEEEEEEEESEDSVPAKKKAKKAKGKKQTKTKTKKKEKEKEEIEISAETEEEEEEEEEKGEEEEEEDEDDDAGSENDVEGSKTIIIEHCKQCNSFKTRANQVKEGLEKRVDGVTVILNPDKPRRGCFEIREEGGKTFISLLDMKRPFKPMKDLDMEKVISDIVDEISTAD